MTAIQMIRHLQTVEQPEHSVKLVFTAEDGYSDHDLLFDAHEDDWSLFVESAIEYLLKPQDEFFTYTLATA